MKCRSMILGCRGVVALLLIFGLGSFARAAGPSLRTEAQTSAPDPSLRTEAQTAAAGTSSRTGVPTAVARESFQRDARAAAEGPALEPEARRSVGGLAFHVWEQPAAPGASFRTGLRPPTASEQEWVRKNARVVRPLGVRTAAPLPASVANMTYLPVTGDQGQYGTCAAFSLIYYYKTYQEAREHGWVRPNPAVNPERVMSPFFVYGLCNGGKDEGMGFANGMRTLLDYGCATWKDLPYHNDRHIAGDYEAWPTEALWRAGIPFRGKAFSTIDTTNSTGILTLKQHLAGGDLAVFSLVLHSNIVRYPADDTGISSGVLYSNTGDLYTPPRGLSPAHAMTLVGYDDNKAYVDGGGVAQKGAFLAVNSWGGWGVQGPGVEDHGFIWIAYPCFQNQTDGLAYTMEDRTGYQPTTFGVYGLEHGRRRDLAISISGGSRATPDWDFPCFPTSGGGLAYTGRIVVDLTDFVKQYSSSCFYLTVHDTALSLPEYQPPVTGRVTEFQIEAAGSATPLVSADAPLATVDHDPTAGGAWANIRLYAGILDNKPVMPGKVEFDMGTHAWCDYNNDGRMDLAVCGTNGATTSPSGYETKIYRNDGDGKFTDIAAGIVGLSGSLAWGDYDNDGLADLIVHGRNSWSDPAMTKLYHNEGGDLFVDSKIALPGAISSVAWADYDNDGRADLAVFNSSPGGVRLYHNDGGGKFTDKGVVVSAESGSMAWGDYDNDGWLDVAITGTLPEFSYSVPMCRVYRNNHDGTFTAKVDLQGGDPGALAWGDYNNDGWLDLAVIAPSYDAQSHSHIYRNTGSGTFVDSGAVLPSLYDPAVAWGDYDNDGRLDLAIFGDTIEKSVVHKKKTSKVYRQFPAGSFRDIGADLPPMSLGTASWCDFDGDGDLDLCLSGYGEMQPDPNPYPLPRYTRIYRGFGAQAPLGLGRTNTPPSVPAGLTASTTGAPAGGIKLGWSPSSDAQTTASGGLYYNIRVGALPGWNNIVSGVNSTPLLGGRLRPTTAPGTPGMTIKAVPANGFYWSVQAIDPGLRASAWSTPRYFNSSGKLPGDVNADGRVDIADLLRCLMMIGGQLTPNLATADLNADGKVSELDSSLIRCLLLDMPAPDQGILDLKTIGSGGGSLSASGIQVTVPAGAFSKPATVELRRSNVDRPYGGRSVSGTMQIDGLPRSFAKPITIRMTPDGTVKNKTFGTLGETVFVPSLGGMRRTFHLLPAKAQSDGTFTFDLPASPSAGLRVSAASADADPLDGYTFDYYCGLISDYSEATGTHFKVRYPSSLLVSEVSPLITDLEEAYSKFKTGSAYNFSYAQRTSWPMDVELKDLGAGVYGYFTSSKLGHNYGSMEFNSTLLKETAELRVTVGHEFFHFVQSLYDPRNSMSRAVLESPNYWLDEASAVWSEELFSATPSTYISSVFTPNMLEPTMGMQAGAEGNAAAHGYGLASLVKFLVNKKGATLPLNLYTTLYGGSKAVDAVLANSTNPADTIWMQDYMVALLKGECYKMSMGDLGVLAPASRRLDVKTASDIQAGKTFAGTSPDLSGQAYMTVLNNTSLPNYATLSHRLKVANPADFSLAVLKAKMGSPTELIATSDVPANGSLRLDIPDLVSLQAQGYRILSLVTNKRRVAPYSGKTPFTLDIGITQDPQNIILTPYVAQANNINDNAFPDINVSGTVNASGLCRVTQWPGTTNVLLADALGEPPINVQIALSCAFKSATKDFPSAFGDGSFDRYSVSEFKKFRLDILDEDLFKPVQTMESSGPNFNIVLDKDKKRFQFNIYGYYDVTVQGYSSGGVPSGSPQVLKDVYWCVLIGDFLL